MWGADMQLCEYPKPERVRNFEIEAISIPIVYNKYGDHDPDGMMYVLREDADRVREDALRNFHLEIPQPSELVKPLVLRVNQGDTIYVKFYNSMKRALSIHVQGLEYDVKVSDGAYVGMNPNTTTRNEINYCWYAAKEGVYLFSDMGDTRSSEEGTNIHGLFGAIIVEPAESFWLNPETGEPLESGLFADVYAPGQPAFREYTVFFHDELEIKDKDGNPPMDHRTGLMSATTGISYRSEPMRNRHPLTDNPADSGEDVSMSSWTYGDPAPHVLPAYVGDPTKIRLLHGGIKETHVFHLHNHQWRLEADNPNSTILDSITLGPQECYTLDILYGAGSLNGMIGDAIFHCHLYPHFHEGMWSLFRVFDRLQDGNGKLPDGTPIPRLVPLKDRVCPPPKDYEHPGYPNFINGQVGEAPFQPPLGIIDANGDNKIEPTPLEEANFVEDFEPGALYTDTCPCHTDDCQAEIKVFELALVQAKITYNSYGWHDPQGRFFVRKEELEKHGGLKNYIRKVECGQLQAEPLVIRANAGDCIEIRLTNLLPEFLEGSPFELKTITDIVGEHVHLVKFDTIVSDGAANGWNNLAGARKYETLVERFFANTQLQTVFFHDHLYANSHQFHGVFGALIVEERGATFHDVQTGEPLESGARAVIRRPDGSSFREFALFVHDFAPLFDRDGKSLNPPKVPGSHDDPGVMGINYRCEPMPERLKNGEDPAYLFSSLVHGDPATPILETYPGDEIIIRLLDSAHEEQHCFNMTGMSWHREIADLASPLAASQTIGVSEAFNIHIDKPYGHGDYLYYFGGIDDAWLGLWGIVRVYDSKQPCLKPLCKGKDRILPLPPCPSPKAVVRKYQVAAVQTDILYNKYGDHDPNGLIFVPLEEMEQVLCGKYQPKPLILRANVGDWIEVTLHNMLGPAGSIPYFAYPSVPLDQFYEPSMRVSLNPQFLQYDAVNDSGINVGFNQREQTVGPGESKRYLWYADQEYGSCILQSFGDMRNHRYHGLFGAVIVEPPGAEWYQNGKTCKGSSQEQAVITAPGIDSFREFVVFIQNGIRLLDADGELIKTTQGEGFEDDGVDHEDTGEKGYNYRSERFANRLNRNNNIDKVFSSRVHGDPATPIFQAHTGDRVIFRTVMAADKPRNTAFAVHGHMWKEQPKDSHSRVIPLQGGISIGNRFDMELLGGASCPGDYLYRSGVLKWDLESGMWGIFRVAKQSFGTRCKKLCRRITGCFCKR